MPSGTEETGRKLGPTFEPPPAIPPRDATSCGADIFPFPPCRERVSHTPTKVEAEVRLSGGQTQGPPPFPSAERRHRAPLLPPTSGGGYAPHLPCAKASAGTLFFASPPKQAFPVFHQLRRMPLNMERHTALRAHPQRPRAPGLRRRPGFRGGRALRTIGQSTTPSPLSPNP
ncbi:hypothetical protein LZ32DRAFT_612106 [Colletotrichum eremochloae]|nr:hypothetical protein LZ32DRAFT_612106 [Colletotrichum eremochloae]